MKLALIAALTWPGRVIGRDGALAWRLPRFTPTTQLSYRALRASLGNRLIPMLALMKAFLSGRATP